jgi:tetratricopeptide (TPR) repeat protein
LPPILLVLADWSAPTRRERLRNCERCAKTSSIQQSRSVHLDRGEETEAHVQQAIRLSPRDVWLFVWLAIAGYAADFLKRYDEAVAWQRRSIGANPNYSIAHFHLASALARLERLKEAKAAAQAGLKIDPRFTIGWFLTVKYSDSPAHLAWR